MKTPCVPVGVCVREEECGQGKQEKKGMFRASGKIGVKPRLKLPLDGISCVYC